MEVSYNGVTHTDGECKFTIDSEPLRTVSGTLYALRQTIAIEGTLLAANSTDLLTRIEEIKTAYRADGGDLSIDFPGGSPGTNDDLASSQCVDGVKVIKAPSFTVGEGGEYSTFRHFNVVLGGIVPLGGSLPNIVVSFKETLSWRGNGGARRVLVPLKNGPWQEQIPYPNTPQTATQEGQIIGLTRHMFERVPGPKWGLWLLDNEGLSMSPQGPQDRLETGQPIDFLLTYSYAFKGNLPFARAGDIPATPI